MSDKGSLHDLITEIEHAKQEHEQCQYSYAEDQISPCDESEAQDSIVGSDWVAIGVLGAAGEDSHDGQTRRGVEDGDKEGSASPLGEGSEGGSWAFNPVSHCADGK